MLHELTILREPELVFRYGQKATDPRAGLALFGPFDADLPAHKRSLPYAVVGTSDGVASFRGFANLIRGPVVSQMRTASPTLRPAFPGFEAAFCTDLPAEPSRFVELDRAKLESLAMLPDPNQRAYAVVDEYVRAIEGMAGKESPFEFIVCVVPDIVHSNCRPQSQVRDPQSEPLSKNQRRDRQLQRKARTRGIRDITDLSAPIEPYRFSPDFRRQIKARAMMFDPPIQIVREWKLSTARDGVCYVGVVFRQVPGAPDNRFAACAAQMFLDDGDGVVLRGDSGHWYSPATHQFHLSKAAAEILLRKVLAEYGEGGGKPLQEIFLHYRASIDDEEFSGFKAACPSGVRLVAVKVRTQRESVRLYREGSRPLLRGSFLKTGQGVGYLWGSGFKPWLQTYDGAETPAPVEIRVQHGDADLFQVSSDILGLTKLNYNECKLGDAQPVTIGFSEAVGEILVSNLGVKNPRSRFKYYI